MFYLQQGLRISDDHDSNMTVTWLYQITSGVGVGLFCAQKFRIVGKSKNMDFCYHAALLSVRRDV